MVVVGTGGIGDRIARLAKAFGTNVIGTRRALESTDAPFCVRLREALGALADLRSECALFPSTNAIGAMLSVAIQSSAMWVAFVGDTFSSLLALFAALS